MRDQDKSFAWLWLCLVAAAVAGWSLAVGSPRVFVALAAALVALLAGVVVREVSWRIYTWRLWRRVDRRIHRELFADVRRRALLREVNS